MPRKPTAKQRQASDESERACGAFAAVVETLDRKAVPQAAAAAPQLREFGQLPRGHVRRKQLGGRLVRRYRADTERVGAIDWAKFKAWLKNWIDTHQAQINFARLIVSVCMLLLML